MATTTRRLPRTLPELRQAVKRGAKLLDREHPGWEGKVDLATLDIAASGCCILGQLFVPGKLLEHDDLGQWHYLRGTHELGLDRNNADVRYGFNTSGVLDNPKNYRRWQEYWNEEILDRWAATAKKQAAEAASRRI